MTDSADLRAGIEAHQGGNLAAAETAYRRVLQERPDDPQALMLLGVVRGHQRDAATAEALLRRSIEVDGKNAEAWLSLGYLLLAKGDIGGARAAFTGATEVAPQLALAWLQLGGCLWRLDLTDQAAAALQQALKLDPTYDVAYELLTLMLNRQGRYAEASEIYRAWRTQNPANPRPEFMLAATTGVNAPTRAPPHYIRQLFDKMAVDFDEHLQGLGYHMPRVVADRLTTRLAGSVHIDVLDAGCGTGLCAPWLRPVARRLVGVDLSPRMIERARGRQIYDELVVQEIVEFMTAKPGAFDAVVCVDTFIYFGEVDELLSAARVCLRAGGLIVFTAERLQDSRPYQLQPTGRYCHSAAYLQEATARASFSPTTLETHFLRRERGDNLEGYIVIAQAA